MRSPLIVFLASINIITIASLMLTSAKIRQLITLLNLARENEAKAKAAQATAEQALADERAQNADLNDPALAAEVDAAIAATPAA